MTASGTLAAMPSDFNGDGYADLAIGVSGERVARKPSAGAVEVLYGSSHGLTSVGDEFWTQASLGLSPRSYEWFGGALASGDFDADGLADLAIGTAGDVVPGSGGSVSVIYGGRSGLRLAGSQLWSQADFPPSDPQGTDFGFAVTSGDFDRDGYWDLAVAIPWAESMDSGGGHVRLLSGGPDGLSVTGTAVLAGVDPVSIFGTALAAGDLDGDGFADLAVGTRLPDDEIGSVEVVYGSEAGLATETRQVWSQDSPGVPGVAQVGDLFGFPLEIGDFNGDAIGDLAAGVPHESANRESAGAVNVLYGSDLGLTSDGAQLWDRGVPGVPGRERYGDQFGWSLAAGDFNGDGLDELVVGSAARPRGGAIVVLGGSTAGLTASGATEWTQSTPGVPGVANRRDVFGWSLAASNFGRSGKDDLAIGNSAETVGGHPDAGSVTILYGRSSGLGSRSAQLWTQDAPGVKDEAERSDSFGSLMR